MEYTQCVIKNCNIVYTVIIHVTVNYYIRMCVYIMTNVRRFQRRVNYRERHISCDDLNTMLRMA